MNAEAQSRTASPRQATLIIGIVVAVALIMGVTVLPTLKAPRSKLLGLPSPDFTLPVMTGGEPGNRIQLSSLRGNVVVLDFWASWCAPCRAQAPIIDRVARKLRDKGVVVLGVDTSGDDWGRAVEFAKGHGISYPTVFDQGDHVASAFRVQALPTLVILDSNGVVTDVRTRVVREDELVQLIEDARASPKGQSGS